MRAIALALQIVLAITCCAQYVYADSLADYVRAQMRKRHIVAISLAVVEGGKVIRAQAFGYTDRDGRTAVSPDSLFQAGSISKSVSALAALHLVEQGKLSLDADVNTELKSWKLPDNEYTKEHRVTLRELLSHTAGITVHGFSGYSVNSPLPTLTQVLDGVMPANTPPIRVEAVPGSRWNYSGGGYTIVQQMVVDATGQPYAKFLQDTVLRPLGMTNSSFDQPLPASEAAMAVTGYYPDGQAVAGRFHVYPEMAAAGLWTTATDLARYAIGVQRAIAGESTGVISKETAARMITEVKAGDGLGVFLEGSGDELRFTHSGRNEGFDAVFVAYAHGGRGAAVMLSANENSGMADRILQVIAKQYGWPGYPTLAVSTHHAAPLAAAALKPAAGYYDFPQNQTSTFTVQNGAIQAAVDGALLDEFKPESDRVFFSDDLNATLTLDRASDGSVSGFEVSQNGQTHSFSRIGPLAGDLKPTPDPDTDLTAGVQAAVLAMASSGGRDVAMLSPGAQKDLADPLLELTGLNGISYVGAVDELSRHLVRHDTDVARTLYYKANGAIHGKYVLVFMTGDNHIADLDLVEE